MQIMYVYFIKLPTNEYAPYIFVDENNVTHYIDDIIYCGYGSYLQMSNVRYMYKNSILPYPYLILSDGQKHPLIDVFASSIINISFEDIENFITQHTNVAAISGYPIDEYDDVKKLAHLRIFDPDEYQITLSAIEQVKKKANRDAKKQAKAKEQAKTKENIEKNTTQSIKVPPLQSLQPESGKEEGLNAALSNQKSSSSDDSDIIGELIIGEIEDDNESNTGKLNKQCDNNEISSLKNSEANNPDKVIKDLDKLIKTEKSANDKEDIENSKSIPDDVESFVENLVNNTTTYNTSDIMEAKKLRQCFINKGIAAKAAIEKKQKSLEALCSINDNFQEIRNRAKNITEMRKTILQKIGNEDKKQKELLDELNSFINETNEYSDMIENNIVDNSRKELKSFETTHGKNNLLNYVNQNKSIASTEFIKSDEDFESDIPKRLEISPELQDSLMEIVRNKKQNKYNALQHRADESLRLIADMDSFEFIEDQEAAVLKAENALKNLNDTLYKLQ